MTTISEGTGPGTDLSPPPVHVDRFPLVPDQREPIYQGLSGSVPAGSHLGSLVLGGGNQGATLCVAPPPPRGTQFSLSTTLKGQPNDQPDHPIR